MAEFIKSSTEVILHQPSGGDWDVYSSTASIYLINLVMHIKGVDGAKELKLKKYHTKSQGETYFLLSTSPDVDSNNATDDAAILTQDLAEDEYRVCAYAQKVQKNDSISSEYSLIKPATSGYGGYRWQLKSRNADGRHTKVVFDAAKVPTLVSVKCGMWGQDQYGNSCTPFVIEVNGFTAETRRFHTGNYVGEATLNVPLPLNMLVKRDDGLLYTLGGAGAGGGNFVTTDKEQLITGKKTFSKVPQVTAKPAAPNDVATVGYVSGQLNAKAPYDVTLDFKVEDDTDGGWVVYSNMEINLDNGKKLKCIHIDNTQPTSANAPVKAVFKAIPATEAINAAPTEQAPTFFDTYQLQDEEYLGTLTYGHILNSQLQDYASYKGPFHTNQYGTTCTIKEATQLRISISELPAAVSKVSLKFDASYLPKTFKASLSGVGMDVTSNVLTNPSGNTPLELLFDVVKLTGLVTLDTAQTITGLKTFDKLPQSSVEPKADADLITKGYADGHYLPVDTKPHKYDILVKMKHDGTSWVGFSDFSVRLRDGTRLDIKHIENQSATTATKPVKAVFKTVKDLKAPIEAPKQQAATFFDSYKLEAGEFTGTVSFYKAAGKFSPAQNDINPWYVYVGYGNANNYDGIYAVSIDNLDKPLLGVNFKFGDAHNGYSYTCLQCGVVFTVDGSALEVAYDGDMSNAFETTIEYPINAQSMIGFVTVDTEQEITALKTFKVLPQSEAVPADDKDLVNKKYVDEKVGAGGGTGGAAPANMVTTDTAQNITEVKTFDKLPKSSVEPTDDTELVNKKYVDDASKKVVTLADAQTISGVKTFSALPQSSVEPATDTDLVNKKYVDAKVGGGGAAGGNVMTLDTEQTVTAVKQFDKFPRLSDNYAYILPTDPKEFVNKAYVDNATTVNNGYALNIYGTLEASGKKIFISNMEITLQNGEKLVLRYSASDAKPGQSASTRVLWSYGDTGKTYGSLESLDGSRIGSYQCNSQEIKGYIKTGGQLRVENKYNFSPAQMIFTGTSTDEHQLVSFEFEGSFPPIARVAFRSSTGDSKGKSLRFESIVKGHNKGAEYPIQNVAENNQYNLPINPAFVPEPYYLNRFDEQYIQGIYHYQVMPILDKPVTRFGLANSNTPASMGDLFNSIAVPVPKKQVVIIGSKPTQVPNSFGHGYEWTMNFKFGDLKLHRKNPSTLADEELFLKFCGPSADGYKGVLTTKKPENYLNPVVEKTDSEMNQYKLEAGECWCKLAYSTTSRGLFNDDDIAYQEKQGSDKLKNMFLPKSSWFYAEQHEDSWNANGGPKVMMRLYIFDSALVTWETQKEVPSDPGDELGIHGDIGYKAYSLHALKNGPNYPKDVPDVNLQTTNVLGIISALEARIKALEDAAPKPQY